MKVRVRYATQEELVPADTLSAYTVCFSIEGEIRDVAVWLDEHMLFETVLSGVKYQQGAMTEEIEAWLRQGGPSRLWNGFTLFAEHTD